MIKIWVDDEREINMTRDIIFYFMTKPKRLKNLKS